MLCALRAVSINRRPVAFGNASLNAFTQAVDINVSRDRWVVWLEHADCTAKELEAASLQLEMTDEFGITYSGTATWLPTAVGDQRTFILQGEGTLDGWSDIS